VEQRSREIAAALGSPIKISCAYEGCEEIFENASDPTRAGDVKVHDPIHGRSLKILVVDDDEELRFLARRSLARGGHEVTEASGGAEALRSIERQMPDLILLDLNMPAPDGLETLRMLRSREATRSVPVIVLTAKDDEESVAASFELGATDFLSKPFTLPQLEARVRACFAVPHARGHGGCHKK
jgi:CheY-like chemotaxis protein